MEQFENEKYLFRLFLEEDLDDLYHIYSNKLALPYFNSDNCHGDIFYYDTMDKMEKALNFWIEAYNNGWFYRYAIYDKERERVIGTVEICKRVSEDAFNNTCILRVDVGTISEKEEVLTSIFETVTKVSMDFLGLDTVITKGPLYAVERLKALFNVGYQKSNDLLVGSDGTLYKDYFTYRK